jgi:hypothetical protein
LGKNFRFKAHVMACFRLRGRRLRRSLSKSAHREETQVLNRVRFTPIAAAVLLASPAFAAWPLDRAAQAEQIADQRIIREIVVDGRLMEPSSGDAPANELRPIWVDQHNVFDRPYQHSW